MVSGTGEKIGGGFVSRIRGANTGAVEAGAGNTSATK